ncbi:ABC transporter substrate-binding protein [Nocardioides sp. zg-DK7169]|uniref:ABC transporter substrate-binding protein n=1 Tax=Nocardioides sp. zg-DK7169 TaxID=2736600 RepID=UPI001553AD9D|nr:ABC transporter substrate-binding protein [Nocardioides sp. zg-DK7169]NPC97863.1 ABC transporter substrate-binding protein [Nocardioides sp. zg-DK7169]
MSSTLPRRRHRRPRRRLPVALAMAISALVVAGCSSEAAGPELEAGADLPDQAPSGTVLRVGDPATQTALEVSGLIAEIDFDIEWANISGGPKTLEAFRADALDVGAVADIPPLFATWTDTEVRILATRETVDPLEHQTYALGVAPGADVSDLDDLAGKKIAYSPGQAQGALVLRVLEKAGLSQEDVELVEMTSVDDSFVNALGSKQVDVAPLQPTLAKTFLAKYERDGARTVASGVRDDAWVLYAPVEVVEDAHKAAAAKKYVAIWAKAQEWINEHPEEFAQAFYVEHEGLSLEDARYVVEALGTFTVPTDWDDLIARHQETADLLAREQGHDELDVSELYDRRFEEVVAEAVDGAAPRGPAGTGSPS